MTKIKIGELFEEDEVTEEMKELTNWANEFDKDCFLLIHSNNDEVIDSCHVAENSIYLDINKYGSNHKEALKKYLIEINCLDEFKDYLDDYIVTSQSGYHIYFNGFK